MAYDRATQPLPHTKDEVGQTCGLCKRVICEVFIDPEMPHDLQCSEFCAEVRNQALAEFRAAKVGDFVYYPCPGCGTIMEDVWHDSVEGQCSACARAAVDKARVEVLRKCRDIFQKSMFAALSWDSLRKEIDDAIGDGK